MKTITLICATIFLFLSRYVYAEDIIPFAVKSTRRYLAINTENQREERHLAPSETEFVRKRDFYEETLGLSFLGSVYHPNLLNFNLDIQLGLSQQREQSPLGESFDTAFPGNVRFDTNWLGKKPYAFSLFVDRKDFTQNYEFFERVRIERTTVGGRGRWTNKLFPLYYSLEKTNREERRTFRPSSDSEFILEFGGDRVAAEGDSRTRLDYTYRDFEYITAGIFEQEGKSHDFRLSNDFIFGKEGRKELTSQLYYLTIKGTQDQDNFNLSEGLKLEHPSNLTSRYFYGFSRADSQVLETATHQGSFEIRHQLYESLTTTFDTHGYLTTATNYDEDSFGPGIDLLYRKNIKVGFLTLNYSLTNDLRKRQASAQIILILDESHTLTDGGITLLNNPDVDSDSIVVTDSIGTTIYLLNIDYTISPLGRHTQISRRATGDIPNGSTVLVDYTTSTNPSFDYTELRQTAGLRTSFLNEKLSFYYRLLSQRYPDSEETENLVLETVEDNMVGMSFSTLPFSGSIEYEEYDSSLSPYDTLRLHQGLSLRVARRSSLSFQSSQEFTQIKNPDEKQRFYDFITQYRLRLNRSTFFNLRGGYRSESGVSIDLTLWTVRSSIEFNRGLLSFKVGYEFEDEDSWGDLRRDHYFYTQWKRRF